ncbi:hypothetical protein B3ORF34 [Pseudomonas phage B3]|uniref:Uncharacterized protein n=1 Tax=Pseudomonas phage B3 TaxID=151599 RepID=Q5ZQY2_9CAUD|nr:hypothetical protein B3ORF34 [Pseudomonas phage B3]AAQ13952.1 hypothetical protein B3ORF34 [Pseudomonas phage B3]
MDATSTVQAPCRPPSRNWRFPGRQGTHNVNSL